MIQGTSEFDHLDGLRYGDYKIQETKAPDGYERDEKEYTFTISNEEVDYVFELANTREIIETSLALTATKALEGRQIEDGEFTFVLADEENKILQEKTNKIIFFLMRLLIKRRNLSI